MDDAIATYLDALDQYREDPNRSNKDAIFEAELDLRDLMGYSLESMNDAYGHNYLRIINENV